MAQSGQPVPEQEIDRICDLIRSVGKLVMATVRNGFETVHKADQSPLTMADLEANRLLKDYVAARFPDHGWLSEETRDRPERLGKRHVWIVDPIDGTKELVSGIPEFAVSVAVIEDHAPLVALVHNPATGELFTAVRGRGFQVNGKANHAPHRIGGRPLILASRTEVAKGKFRSFEGRTEIRPVGSVAYKLGLLAAGRADATVSLEPKNEWDIAAGVLLVQESGGRVTDLDGKPFLFNQPTTLVNGVVATTADAYNSIRALINECLV